MTNSLFRIFLLSFFLFLTQLSAENVDSTDLSRMQLLDTRREMKVGDRLVYSVVEERESPETLFVDDQGQINVPLIGVVDAKNRNCKDVAFDIKKRLEVDYFHRATVLLRFQFADNTRGRLNIVGLVKNQGPMIIPADEIVTVSGAILRAGGFGRNADRTKVELIRKNPKDPSLQERFTLDVGNMLDTGNFDDDMLVKAEDMIVIPKLSSSGGQIYIVGAVSSPGLYDIPAVRDFTVSKAILRAGGFSRFANKKKVKLIRGQDTDIPEDERTIIVDMEKILEEGNRDNDPLVKPNDLIRVEEKNWAF